VSTWRRTSVGVDAFLHYTRRVDPIRARLIAMHPDTIVGFGDTRIRTETATFELRASEVANPTPNHQLIVDQTFVVQGERSGAIPTGWCGQSMCGRRKRLGAQVSLFRPSRTNPAMAATTPIPNRIQYSTTGAPPEGAPASGAGAAAMNRT
jgi:hypothetical protein